MSEVFEQIGPKLFRWTDNWIEHCEEEGVALPSHVPTVFELCSDCRGSGVTTSHVECEGGGITRSEMDEMGPEFERDYFSGVYDRPCPTCKGRNVEAVVSWHNLSKELNDLADEWYRDWRMHYAECEAERRFGA